MRRSRSHRTRQRKPLTRLVQTKSFKHKRSKLLKSSKKDLEEKIEPEHLKTVLLGKPTQGLRKRLDDQVVEHNKMVLATLDTGDLVEFQQNPTYSHWAVFIDDESVAHLTSDEDDEITDKPDSADERFRKASVHQSDFLEIAGNSKARRNNFKDKETKPLCRSDIMQRVADALFEDGTSKFENSKAFATWCRYGDSKSTAEGFGLWIPAYLTSVFKKTVSLFEYTWVKQSSSKSDC